MYIKEYRIPLPMSLEEYRIAQLYMIQKKSLQESTGSGSAVEIIQNTPYENGPGGNGQYTKKIYHIGSHLPGWLKSLLPKTALRVEEEAWNAYPYTKTRHTCPFVEKFSIDIETHYLADSGESENVFKLSSNIQKNLEVDLIDPIKDPFPSKDYKEEEDPHIFVSQKTKRGPLTDNWLQDYRQGLTQGPIMCAYKLIRVEFKYWGMQSKIETFIQNGIRNPMLVGHRQAWSWQDEWYGLTMEDIRELERKAQLELEKKKRYLLDNIENGSNNSAESSMNGRQESEDEGNLTSDCQISSERRKESDLSETLLNSKHEELLKLQIKNMENAESDEELFFDCAEYPDEINEEKERKDVNSNVFSTHNTSSRTLIFVIQGGSLIDHTFDDDSKQRDFETFERVFSSVCNNHYPGSRNSIHFERIECPTLSLDIMEQLKEIHALNLNEDGTLSNSFPFAALPLLMYQSPEFLPAVDDMIKRVNSIYKEQSCPSKNTNTTDIYMIADCIGGILLYQALSYYSNNLLDDSISLCSDDVGTNDFSTSFDTSPSFDFIANGVFMFGSPIGLIAFKQGLVTGKDITRLKCGQLYNLFHPFDPMSSRVEPLLDKSCSKIPPSPVPGYQSFPYNEDIEYNYSALYSNEGYLTDEDMELNNQRLVVKDIERKISSSSAMSRSTVYYDNEYSFVWWGTKRIDYKLNCPESLQQFPVSTLMSLCYNSYWESKDLVTFILWQILNTRKYTTVTQRQVSDSEYFLSLQPKEKWIRKRTKMKIKNMSPNHRANDIITLCGAQQFISGRFTYGSFDLANLSKEKIDIYISRRPQMNDWTLLGTELTDTHGKLMFSRFPSEHQEPGVYSIKMVVRGDHTSVSCNMALLPPQTEAVVFSIDGSFLASYSLRAIEPRIRGGAVDVVRYWQDLGYLIIYVSSRLLYQKDQVMSWLIDHKFPFGIVSFCEHVSTDFQRHKINFLKNIIKHENVTIHAAYGSSRDIPVYLTELNLCQKNIFFVGKKSKTKKYEHINWITNGYAAHLMDLKKSALSKRSLNKNTFLALGDFGKSSKREDSVRKKNSADILLNEDNHKSVQRSSSFGQTLFKVSSKVKATTSHS